MNFKESQKAVDLLGYTGKDRDLAFFKLGGGKSALKPKLLPATAVKALVESTSFPAIDIESEPKAAVGIGAVCTRIGSDSFTMIPRRESVSGEVAQDLHNEVVEKVSTPEPEPVDDQDFEPIQVAPAAPVDPFVLNYKTGKLYLAIHPSGSMFINPNLNVVRDTMTPNSQLLGWSYDRDGRQELEDEGIDLLMPVEAEDLMIGSRVVFARDGRFGFGQVYRVNRQRPLTVSIRGFALRTLSSTDSVFFLVPNLKP